MAVTRSMHSPCEGPAMNRPASIALSAPVVTLSAPVVASLQPRIGRHSLVAAAACAEAETERQGPDA